MERVTIQVTYFTCRKLMKDSVAYSITWDHLTRSSKLSDKSSRHGPKLRFVYSNDTYNTDNRTFWVKLGTSNGLEFLVVNNLSDYYYPTMNVIGFQILTFNPFEYPEAITGNYRRDILEMGETSYFEVQTSVHRANRDITRYSKRKVRLNFGLFNLLLSSSWYYREDACFVKRTTNTSKETTSLPSAYWNVDWPHSRPFVIVSPISFPWTFKM